MFQTKLVIATCYSLSFVLAMLGTALQTSHGRGLTNSEMAVLHGGDIGSCCNNDPDCAPIYYENDCEDPVRNSSGLCVAQSVVGGNIKHCTIQDPPGATFCSETPSNVCIRNYSCHWLEAPFNRCDPGDEISSHTTPAICMDTCF